MNALPPEADVNALPPEADVNALPPEADVMGQPFTCVDYEVVIPSVGRASLATLLESLAAAGDPQPAVVHVVDGTGRGPAAARNVGWRAASAPWVVFLDDDVVVPPGWCAELADDLSRLEPRAAGSQGRIRVPEEAGTGAGGDWARNVTKLETATWATADMAYRRRVLAAVGGFDERFPRAYREDADLGLRVVGAGWTIEPGRRVVLHPVRPERPWVSVRAQRGNADDALMRRLHGPGWQHRARAGRGRRPLHLAACAGWLVAAGSQAAVVALSLPGPPSAIGLGRTSRPATTAAAGLGRTGSRVAMAGVAVGAGLTAELFAHRLRGARRHAAETGGRVGGSEIAWLAATSAAIPQAAAWHTVRGWFRARRLVPTPPSAAGARRRPTPPAAVLFDRDGTLVHDVPYNGDPARVELRPDALPALARLRAAGVKVGLVTNQSGVALGLIRPDQVEAVNRRLVELAGPFDAVLWCPHGPDDGCGCRKPAPGMVLAAARALGVPPQRCAVVGDTGADVGAALAAGARGVLVPNDVTAFEEIEAAAETAADLVAAVERLLGPPPPGPVGIAGPPTFVHPL